MKPKNQLALALLLGSLALTGCGGEPYGGGDNPPFNPGPGSGPGSTTPPSPGFENAQEVPYVVGPSSPQIVHVQTDSILRVRVIADDGGTINVAGWGFVVAYGCITVNVGLVGQAGVRTRILRVPGRTACLDGTPALNDESVHDLSNRLAPTGIPQDYQLEIRDPTYDWRCAYQWFGYCPMAAVYSTHQVHGKIFIVGNTITP